MTVSREDLRQAVADIKEHVGIVVKPLSDDVADHDTILRGESKKNGLVGDVNKIKTTHAHVKWAIAGGLTGVVAFVKSWF